MTVVNPKSISGINSITTGSGSDDLLTIHTNNGTERLRVDSTGATKIVTGIVTTLTATTGIVTTLTTNTLTANSTTKVGSGVTLSPDGDVFSTGVSTCLGTSLSNSVIVGSAVTISESGIEASGIGITCANINGNQLGGRRNFFINGAMQVHQRFTNVTASGSYGVDRWWLAHGGSATLARSTTVPSGEGFDYSLKVSNVSGDAAIGQPIELMSAGKQGGLASGKKITFSFYAKCDSGTDSITVICNFRQGKYTSTNQVGFTNSGTSVTLTTTWTRFTVTMTIPTCHAASTMAAFELNGISGISHFTGFQMEIGEQATPFEHRSFAEEVLLCQRYYTQMKPGTNYAAYGVGCCYSTYQTTFIVTLPTEMRAAPTFAYTGSLSNFYDISGNSTTFQSMTLTQRMASNRIMQMVINTAADAAINKAVFMLGTSATENTDFTFDAEI